MAGEWGLIAELRAELAAVRAEVRALQTETTTLRARVSELEQENADLLEENGRLREENGKLREALEKERRAGKRQAAPFSKGKPKTDPKRPGRKPGKSYGRQATRPIPNSVDRQVEVDCPLFCPQCLGAVHLVGIKRQYQVEIPPMQPVTTEFVIHYGECQRCGRQVQGRAPEQTSDATGVGGVQLGPNLIAVAAHLNKVGGMSYGKITDLLARAFGVVVSRGGLARALARLARKAAPLYEQLVQTIRQLPVVYPDETGWKIGGRRAWLWVFTNGVITVYAIRAGRGFDEAAEILGADYDGIIGSDGWAPYQKFENAQRQTCLTHLSRRCKEILETCVNQEQREWITSIKNVLQKALELRDRRDTAAISAHGVSVARGRLEARLDALLDDPDLEQSSIRFGLHLWRHRDEIFLFLRDPRVRATNALAEQAIRPAVINRKTCAGNRTDLGAQTQEILTSVFQTVRQQGQDIFAFIRQLLCDPVVSPLQLPR